MTLYSYTARAENGDLKKGSIDSVSIQSARDVLSKKQLHAEEIHEATLEEREDSILTKVKEEKEPVQSWTITDANPNKAESASDESVYFPIGSTLRLYAGWLLAWYCIVYAIGYYQFTRDLPFRIPYAESLFLSPLVLSFTLTAFLYLCFSTLHKALGRGKKLGWLLFSCGLAFFLFFRMNVL